jgi:3-mercaptopropionate dioxygenase
MQPSEPACGNPILNDLVRSVRSVLALEKDPEDLPGAVAQALRPFLRHPGLLTPAQRETDPERYRQHILHVDEEGAFSIVALVWLPGQSTKIHDHVSWCVIGLAEGREREESYRLVEEHGDSYLLPIGECTSTAGAVSALHPPGDIHTVSNPGPGTAVSIHIYGADVRKLGSSIRRVYELPVIEVLPVSLRPAASF